MSDVAVLEAAQHMRDRIDLADMAEELVAEAFALRGAAHEAGDVDEFQLRRHDLRGLRELGADFEPFVGHGNAPDIRLNGAERIIRGLGGLRRRQRVEERRFADIRQTNDAAIETHKTPPTPVIPSPVSEVNSSPPRKRGARQQYAASWIPAFAGMTRKLLLAIG